MSSAVIELAVLIAVVLVMARLALMAAVEISVRLRLTDEFIGMTFLSIGTSFPEIVTHVAASLKILDRPESMQAMSALAVGTNIGSDVFQQNFLLGAVALLGPLGINRRELALDVGGLIATAVILLAFSIGGQISRIEGGVLVLVYLLYLNILRSNGQATVEGTPKARGWGLPRSLLVLTASFVVMGLAANRALDDAVLIVENSFLSYSFFGVLVLGIAAALPELATSAIAVIKKRGGISAGVLIGSNITNPAFALGLGAAISTYTVPNAVIEFDLPVKIATAIYIYLVLRRYETLPRLHALSLMSLYVIYLLSRQALFPSD